MSQQQHIDKRNAEFWQELCGSSLARQAGILGNEPDALERYDRTYFDFYPYLKSYVDRFDLRTKRVLEIGLGYGTLGSYIFQSGADYLGLDIAEGPVTMMQHRLRIEGVDSPEERARQGSALDIPHPDNAFDFVYSIGCLHHTGDLAASLAQVARVLRPGGRAIVMLYHRNSLRQWMVVDLPRLRSRLWRSRELTAEEVRSRYDTNEAGEAAPHTDYVSRRDVRRLFGDFGDVRIETRNFDDVRVRGARVLTRDRALSTPIERLLGLDLYIVARA